MKNIKCINIILPYKEFYTDKNAGAVSLLVSELYKKSIYKKKIKIYGSSLLSYPLTKNYIAIIAKKPYFFFSRTNFYLSLLNKKINNNNNSIIEIHNRPQAAQFFIKNKPVCKKILYFHNNPLELRGSIEKKDRNYLLENLDMIIFVSEWVKRKFFFDLDMKDSVKTKVIYPGWQPLKKIPRKERNIVFIGKLNYSKGYYIFLDTIIRILNKYKRWKAIIIGDDPRKFKKIIHKNLVYEGWLSHSNALQILKKSQIVIVPSLWDEPLGRTSIEAASMGCATIISKKGGLVETNSNGIFLNKFTSEELFKKIEMLINKKKIRNKLMKDNLKNFKHKLKNTIKSIEEVYAEI
jgi:glycosyltransferase involved in cell wall biosynthesis